MKKINTVFGLVLMLFTIPVFALNSQPPQTSNEDIFVSVRFKGLDREERIEEIDRKSTRLNSSH